MSLRFLALLAVKKINRKGRNVSQRNFLLRRGVEMNLDLQEIKKAAFWRQPFVINYLTTFT
jgi:hypothetical protein